MLTIATWMRPDICELTQTCIGTGGAPSNSRIHLFGEFVTKHFSWLKSLHYYKVAKNLNVHIKKYSTVLNFKKMDGVDIAFSSYARWKKSSQTYKHARTQTVYIIAIVSDSKEFETCRYVQILYVGLFTVFTWDAKILNSDCKGLVGSTYAESIRL